MDDGADGAAPSENAMSIQEENLRLHQIIDHAEIGLSLRCINPPEFLYVNPAYRTLFALAPGDDMLNLAEALAAIHPDDQVRLRSEYFARADAGLAAEIEMRIIRRTGEVRWVRATATPVRSATGPVTRVSGTVEDITARKAIETALVQTDLRFRQFAGSVATAFALISVESGTYLYVNPAFVEMFGFDPTELDRRESARKTFLARVHPDDLQQVTSVFPPGFFEQRISVEVEYRIIMHDTERWVRTRSFPGRDDTGTVTTIAGLTEDITERKHAEHVMHEALENAERANAAKSDFLSRMSHELRTPLNAILGFAQLLQLDELSGEQATAVEHILRGGQHLLEMINDVLDISRIESNTLEFSLESVQISGLLDDAIGMMEPTARDSGIEILRDPECASAQRFASADRRRLRQILLNLLSNAIKYNRPGGRVQVTCSATADGWVRVAVSDTGRGIEPDNMARLFTPFERLETFDVDGVGIGLALSRQLARSMNGAIEASSTIGQGSTFTVVVPEAGTPQPLSTAESDVIDNGDSQRWLDRLCYTSRTTFRTWSS